MIRKILLGLLLLLIGLQFIRPARNTSNQEPFPMAEKYPVPGPVSEILKTACNDCHTNLTAYPWYANVQPVGWWLNNHVKEGKRHLNFSNFTNQSIARQNHKFEEIIETVEEKEMPIPSYTYLGLHSEARLTDHQRTLVIDWAKEQMATLASQYPADSLVLRRRR